MAKPPKEPEWADVRNMELLLEGADFHYRKVPLNTSINNMPKGHRGNLFMGDDMYCIIKGPLPATSDSVQKSLGDKHGAKRKRGCAK